MKTVRLPTSILVAIATLLTVARGQSVPLIRTEPQSLLVLDGRPVRFSITAVGDAPLRYQWRRDDLDQDLPGATNRIWTIEAAQSVHEGSYSVRVSNDAGAVSSRPVSLTVAPPLSDFAARTFRNSRNPSLPYRLFVPPGATLDRRYPLVLFLHGGLETGTDNTRQLTAYPEPLIFISRQNQRDYPCYLVAPQCPPGSEWETPAVQEQLRNLLESLAEEFPIDTDRLYVTGFSFGGYGTWNLAARHPDLFAAALPMCGGMALSSARVAALRHLPLWNFHAINDDAVSVADSRAAISALRRAGGRPIYTEFQTGGHLMFQQVYLDPRLVRWTFAQRRGFPVASDPAISITSHPTDRPLRTSVPLLNLAGVTAMAPGEAVSQIVWTNLLNRVGGPAVGVSPWTIEAIPLRHPGTNWILVTASTSTWIPEYGGTTTFNDTLLVETPVSPRLTIGSQDHGLVLGWEADGEPWRLQRAFDLGGGEWTDVPEGVLAPVVLPAAHPEAFFRLIRPP